MKYVDRFQFKFIIKEGDDIIWESGDNNRTFEFNKIKELKNSKNTDFEMIRDKTTHPAIRLKCEWRKKL
jgi:hypothetical protein